MKKFYVIGYIERDRIGEEREARFYSSVFRKKDEAEACAARQAQGTTMTWWVAEAIETVKAKPVPADIEPIVEAAE